MMSTSAPVSYTHLKRLAAVILAGVMVFGLAACGGNEDAGNSTEAASGTESDKGTADSGSKDTSGDWDSTNDITVVSREDGSGTRGAFVELFGIEEEVNGENMDMTTEEMCIRDRLTTAIECIRYGLSPAETLDYIHKN